PRRDRGGGWSKREAGRWSDTRSPSRRVMHWAGHAGRRGSGMKRYIFRRLGYAIISLVLLSATIFVFVRLTGDPTVLLVEPGASRGDIEALRKDLGLDQPLWVQYGAVVKNLVHGDFGNSYYYRAPVLELYLSRLPHSLLLAATAMVFSLLIGIPSGVLAAVRVNGWGDGAGKVFALLGLSMPSFWVGLLMILFF